MSPKRNGAGSEIHTIVTQTMTHLDVNIEQFGRSVWRESSFEVITFETTKTTETTKHHQHDQHHQNNQHNQNNNVMMFGSRFHHPNFYDFFPRATAPHPCPFYVTFPNLAFSGQKGGRLGCFIRLLFLNL